MEVRMKDILDRNEMLNIPLYFCGDETDEFVEIDVDSIYDELRKIMEEMGEK